ncbi:hypothetical protein [Bacillus alkalicellulosilyticus]|nr:hypothetical protein [Bacillus alkalicellulosilyticus]
MRFSKTVLLVVTLFIVISFVFGPKREGHDAPASPLLLFDQD